MKYGMAFDLDRCIGCFNCQVACKDEHVGNNFPPIAKSQPTFGHFWMRLEEKEQAWSPTQVKVTYIPKPCNHCEDPSCMKAAKNGAIYKRDDGIVIIDPEKAKGQKELVAACPYGSIFWNDELNVAQKCTFCAHLLDDGWSRPRCVQTCLTSCIYFGDLDDPNSGISGFIARNKVEPIATEYKTKPAVAYAGLPKPHISGTVINAKTDDCVANATVTLNGGSGAERTCTTDAFGDFAFHDVAVGKHSIRIEVAGYALYTRQFQMKEQIEYLGEMVLQPGK
jgi:Fe-S-cluster-containing dehydrogenase component